MIVSISKYSSISKFPLSTILEFSMVEIDFKKIEDKWQKKWEQEKIFEVQDNVEGKDNYYVFSVNFV